MLVSHLVDGGGRRQADDSQALHRSRVSSNPTLQSFDQASQRDTYSESICSRSKRNVLGAFYTSYSASSTRRNTGEMPTHVGTALRDFDSI